MARKRTRYLADRKMIAILDTKTGLYAGFISEETLDFVLADLNKGITDGDYWTWRPADYWTP